MLNLIDYLTELDNKRIENFVKLYGTNDYIGNEEYLSDWNNSKKKLFRLLGGNLIYSMPIEIEKKADIIEAEMRKLVDHDFMDLYDCLYYDSNDSRGWVTGNVSEAHWDRIPYIENLISNKVPELFKVTKKDHETGEVKTLKITPGMKTMKAIKKVIDFLALDNEKIHDLFEDFRLQHSRILNDKTIKGNLCFSIHPLDFITMSDNASNWSSCMSWTEAGCYHAGTVEMMNSNLVICVYLEGGRPYNFSQNFNKSEDDEWIWNNKRWRQLFYCNKDIIVGGKAYPYRSDDLTYIALNKLREMAKENWNHTYTYGIEKYRDMIHINTIHKMNNNRMWARGYNPIKHNIIFDTNAMYNDMFNDKKTPYWCVRNKVKSNIMLNLSGKVCCARCGEYNVVENIDYNYFEDYIYDPDDDNISEEDADDYNYRYAGTKRILCHSCYDINKCSICTGNRALPTVELELDSYQNITGTVLTKKTSICKACFLERLIYCPTCGKLHQPSLINYRTSDTIPYGLLDDFDNIESFTFKDDIVSLEPKKGEDYIPKKVMLFNECPRCTTERRLHNTISKKISANSHDDNNFKYVFFNKEIISEEEAQKYRYENLKHPTEEDFYKIYNKKI